MRTSSNQQSALLSQLNTISHEHTRLQLESGHRLEQLKQEIRNYAKRQSDESNRTRLLVERLQELAEEGARVANEEKILTSLEFDERKRRFDAIKEAHPRTFEWMLEDSSTGFREWLQCQNGIYWISGKAGSGKSTLMKFLSDHRSVKYYLHEWAGPDADIFLISWFFWNAGSPMQKSKQGLFQSLLFQVMRRCPWCIPIVCPERWQDKSGYGEHSDPWTVEELSNAFNILAQQPLQNIRFCIFIDGLDEYDGLPNEIIRILENIAESPSIKICLSSRPWNEFQTAFGDGKCNGTILIQDYTKPDVERFVKEILKEDRSFTRAERADPRYRDFVSDVIEKANGVFLWVYLVVRQLLKGLGETNRLRDLQNRLKTMPQDLETYFQQIFDRIDRADRTESAKVFLITAHAVSSLSVTAYHYLEEEERNPDFALEAAPQPMTPS